MNPRTWMLGVLLWLGGLAHACAFSLDDLQQQLQAHALVSGTFVQEKHLRGLDQPLRSTGAFTLAPGLGLLWTLHTPITQELRITPKGVARRVQGTWQTTAQQSGRENRLFLAVLAGDTRALQTQFELALRGDAQAWQLRLTPSSALLRQIFTQISIDGGAQVTRIELEEPQGDHTILHLTTLAVAHDLSPAQAHAFSD